MPRTARSYRVTIANVGRTIDCAANQTVLEAAVAAGIDFPYTCATGNCGTCCSRLDAGKVALLPRSDAALGPQQKKAGLTLACRARPRSDLAVTWLGRGGR
ncbi:MAG: 2Fe-2S iron-sulfur cluster binding domain-containing protein [Reyranella sp.]|nr:2Fe-2S iron-sulfur cluster binding domain-containing protein [Reyranella sp.]